MSKIKYTIKCVQDTFASPFVLVMVTCVYYKPATLGELIANGALDRTATQQVHQRHPYTNRRCIVSLWLYHLS